MPDVQFEHPRLAALYDAFDADRRDLDVYLAIARELKSRRVLDVGCGTGTFALLLAREGFEVTALDPALASVDVARAKPEAERVEWMVGDAGALRELQVDLGVGEVEQWNELTEVALPLVRFRTTFVFRATGDVLTSDSTLRFREREDVEAELRASGYVLDEVRGAPDRPGRELVFFARRPD